ncbi:MAG: hypothetical protein AB7I48_06665 [Planctomycetaceae bacterium]
MSPDIATRSGIQLTAGPVIDLGVKSMQAVEFQTTIKNGAIEIPSEFRDRLTDRVRVIVLVEDRVPAGPNIIDRLLKQPLRIPGFQPLTREEAHAR